MQKHQLHIVSAKTWGGAETYVYNLAKHAVEHGENIVIVTDGRYPEIARRFNEIASPITFTFSFELQLLNAVKLVRILKKYKVSTINYHSGKVALLAVVTSILSKVPCVFFKHNISLGKQDFYHRFLLDHLAAVICVSNAVYTAELQGIPRKFHPKVHTLYTGIPLPEPEVVKRKKSQRRVRVGYAGRIVQNKGIEILLKVCHQFPNSLDLLIAGDCSSEYACGLKKKYGEENIHFLGEKKNLAHFYQDIDIFVAPSVVPEAFGLSMCEAMSFGVPVIATTSGAQAELIQDGVSGLLIRPSDEGELRRSLLRLSEDENLREQIGVYARRRIEEMFTIDRFYAELNYIYRSIG